jgi:hypothetical protein
MERSFLAAIAGLIVPAVGVNMIELLCSSGIPAVYTVLISVEAALSARSTAARKNSIPRHDACCAIIATLNSHSIASRLASCCTHLVSLGEPEGSRDQLAPMMSARYQIGSPRFL